MKIVVNGMPLSEYECPFSKEYTTRLLDADTKRRHEVILYECVITKDDCDLNCGKCSGLMVLTCPM